ncbi:MAG: sulfite exporter TauE/SafE family protein, partial [Desulfobulbaceae bacterium]|nr:sulfite exporter TauE/SafE family protein [Desulfobulbaceae bacterium]
MEEYLRTSLSLSLIAAFSGGLFASLTPCIYPLVPVTVAFIGSSNLGGSKKRGFFLSINYVLGTALVYALLGLFSAATGRFFGTISTSPITILIVGNIFLLFALCMLDAISLPSFYPKYLTKVKGAPGAFLFGMASGLIAGPCTTPILGILLTYVGSTGNILLGAIHLFLFSLGFSVILLLAGTFSGVLATLPRPGHWMVTIKKILGILMLVLAEYFI